MGSSPLRIGVISDTHGKFDERIPQLFAGVDHIIHAGDIGDEEIIWKLEEIAPVIAVRGNIDPNTTCFPTERRAVIGERTFFVRHQFSTVEKMTQAQKRLIENQMPDVIIFGHSHQAYRDQWRGTLLFNPGGAGPKRFNLPRSIGLLELTEEMIDSKVITLND